MLCWNVLWCVLVWKHELFKLHLREYLWITPLGFLYGLGDWDWNTCFASSPLWYYWKKTLSGVLGARIWRDALKVEGNLQEPQPKYVDLARMSCYLETISYSCIQKFGQILILILIWNVRKKTLWSFNELRLWYKHCPKSTTVGGEPGACRI